MEGIAAALAPEQLAGFSPEERAARAELAGDALRLLEDAEVAVDSGEPVDVVVALVNAINELAVRLRDRVLDQAVASSPAPDHWPK
ncbi:MULTISPECIES: hypothetical protein [unclassified Streptomyces]|uniref:hypothetical protein n=1 Tax=unclassified Streptomyces TaxID=2593676 RepID=UPI0023664848|nr:MULTISPECIES: hypothetical protein [unclassified Streptomyces]MDF3141805.1 hypothetical protein [Streptomyces sp. T21Q-yed]WDF45094.1 hypothetical protein PBV52_51255 [Streptomyces sp. T12]